jgi:mono/diheme cytochrome c family protein
MRPAAPTRHARAALTLPAACSVLGLAISGCGHAPGRPGPGPEVPRPENVLSFNALYKDNCAGCHGDNGRDGAAIMLANPAFVAIAKDHLNDIISHGVSGSLMPAFAISAGGELTDQQVQILVQGIEQWGNPALPAGITPPPFTTTLHGDAAHGLEAYGQSCARCHGPNGAGGAAGANIAPGASGSAKPGSIADTSFLALFSDQYLRSVIIAGRPDQGMPDWRTDGAEPLTDQQVTDIVAWMASKRVAEPGQPYPAQH